MTISVQVFQVGGQIMLPGGDLTDVAIEGTWENVLDGAPGTAQARVTLQENLSLDDYPILAIIRPYYHELKIMLDGEVVFEGPIRYYSGPVRKGAVISADDISAWTGLRMIHDVFDWSTGADVSTIVDGLVRSAFDGGPFWSLPDLNITPFMDVQPITTQRQMQNGTIPAGLTQGDLQVHEPFEVLWDVYLNPIVGNQAHMSCQGRRINFWPYGEALGQLSPVSSADFTEFPNLTRNGDKFTTFAAMRGNDARLSLTIGAAAGDDNFSLGSGPWKEAEFYFGQSIQSGTGLQLPIGTLIRRILGFYPLSRADLSYDYTGTWDVLGTYVYPATLLSEMPIGAAISGRVMGQAGGSHPDWPLLVERFVADSTINWKQTADVIAGNLIQLDMPFDSLDVAEFKPSVGRYLPWDFTKIVCGYGVLVTTQLGSLALQISHVGGSWSSSDGMVKLDLHVGLQTLLSAQTTVLDYPAWQANVFTPADPPAAVVVGVNNSQAQRRRRRRRVLVAGLYYKVKSDNKPDALFFPDSSLMIQIGSGSDATAIAAMFPTPTSTQTVSNNQYDALRISCQLGSG